MHAIHCVWYQREAQYTHLHTHTHTLSLFFYFLLQASSELVLLRPFDIGWEIVLAFGIRCENKQDKLCDSISIWFSFPILLPISTFRSISFFNWHFW